MTRIERRIGMFPGAWWVSGPLFVPGVLIALAVGAVQDGHASLIEGREADNNAQHASALYAARVAVLAAERFLSSNEIKLEVFDADGSDGLYESSVEPVWEKVDWSATAGIGDRAVHVPGYPAAYVIEHIEPFASRQMATNINLENYGSRVNMGVIAARKTLFRITARGADVSGDAHAFIQVTYEVGL
ncbi:MAG: hypothetical protein ABW072_11440 [Sedimenticola sp.]